MAAEYTGHDTARLSRGTEKNGGGTLDQSHTQTAEKTHTLTLNSRKDLLITGVLDVDHYDENMTTVHTTCGILTIEGDALHVRRLTLETGELVLDGRITALSYTEEPGAQTGGGGFFARLFR
ncbi:MAG: YabP/YqfC family sporulation protein [Eubacteriales bacterium]